MNRRLHIAATTLCTALCTLVFLPSPAKADISSIRSSNSEIWGSVGGSFLNYKEQLYAPDIPDSEHGWTPTIGAGLDYMTNNNWYFALEGSVSFGDDQYNGSYYDNNTGYYDIPAQTTTNETISKVDGKVGKGFALGSHVMLTPYAELGFRYWDRAIPGNTEDYQNFDMLGGLMFQVAPINSLILTAYGAAGTTFGAQMKSSLSGDTYDLGNSGMYKLGGKIAYLFTPRWDVFTALDYDAFRFMQSPVQNDGSYEPSSKTEETTLRVGIGYHFH